MSSEEPRTDVGMAVREDYWSEVSRRSGTQVVHISEPHEEFIGRSSGTHLLNSEIGETGWLGNPYVLEEHGGDYGREESVSEYARALLEKFDESLQFRAALAELKGANLACYCRKSDEEEPLCHGDVLVDVIDGISYAEGQA